MHQKMTPADHKNNAGRSQQTKKNGDQARDIRAGERQWVIPRTLLLE